MEISPNYLDKFKKPTAPNERAEQLQRFLDKGVIRVKDGQGGYRPITAQELGVRLAHIPTGDLHAFYRQCEGARSFGRWFWWSIRTEPAQSLQHVDP